MNEDIVKNIVASAVKATLSNLPDNGEMNSLFDKCKVKIHQTVSSEIKNVVKNPNGPEVCTVLTPLRGFQ